MKSFGEQLRLHREAKGVSTWEVEKQTGISRSNLVSIEKGRRPASDDVLKKLASIPDLDITYEKLLAWKAIETYGPETLMKATEIIMKERGLKE